MEWYLRYPAEANLALDAIAIAGIVIGIAKWVEGICLGARAHEACRL